MPNITVLPDPAGTKKVFSESALTKLGTMGSVIYNTEPGKPGPGDVTSLGRKSEIIITSWGCPGIDNGILETLPQLKIIVHAAGSVKSIVTDDVWKRGIRVSNAAEALGRGVAETALGLSIVSLKRLWDLRRDTENGMWWEADKSLVKDLYGITIGVVGAGYAGRHFINLLKNFQVNVLLYDPTLNGDQITALGAKKVSLADLCKQSDLVSIHAPSIPETYRMIRKDELSALRDNAIIVNTSRGEIIDEEALSAELRRGRIFACLDVTDPEPPARDSELRKLPNVILTPHIAGAVTNGLKRIGMYVVDEIERYLEQKPLRGEVFQERLKVMG